MCVCWRGIISWLADESLSSQEGFCSMEFVCFKAGWCSRQCVPEPISNSEVHYVVRGKIMLIMYVCHTVKRMSLCSCMRVIGNFVWRGDGCGLCEVILWFLGVTEQICVEPPRSLLCVEVGISGIKVRYELPNQSSNFILFFYFTIYVTMLFLSVALTV